MDKTSKVYVAGHRGLVGSSVFNELENRGYSNVIVRTSDELDLRNQYKVGQFFEDEKPEYVFLCAARVGGIHANNTYPAQFIYDNLILQSNVIQAAYKSGVKKLLFLGSSCIYPKFAPQPMKEEHLLTGLLEPTNEPYAIAKIAGIKTCEAFNKEYNTNFISLMPTNLYGPNDNFDLENSHVLPALLRKFHEAKIANDTYVEVWGSGKPKREFLYVNDLADACIHFMENYDAPTMDGFVNIGTGIDITILELAQTIAEIVGFKGEIKFNSDMPDGTPRKLLDVSKASRLGWGAKTNLIDGITQTYKWYLERKNN